MQLKRAAKRRQAAKLTAEMEEKRIQEKEDKIAQLEREESLNKKAALAVKGTDDYLFHDLVQESTNSKPKRNKIKRRTRTFKKKPKTVNMTETPKDDIVEEVSGESSSDEESVSDESSVLSSIDEWQARIKREKEQKEKFEDIRLT